MQTHDFLRELHRRLRPRGYFEVGVFRGHSLSMAACPAVGIDPAPQVQVDLGPNARVVQLPSDAFFALEPEALRDLVPQPLDLALIDGLHHWEQALRDVRNVWPWMSHGGLIVLDDVLPREQAEAGPKPVTAAWAGDVWKVVDILRAAHVPLTLVDTQPTGCALVATHVRAPEFAAVAPTADLPDWVLHRWGAVAPDKVLEALA